MYEYGHGVAQNYATAKRHYQQAAKQGFVPAQQALQRLQ